jgi:hypothetical protein
MKKTLVKGLIAAIIAFIASYVAQAETVNYVYIGVYIVGFSVVYFAKNYAWPSTSPLGFINVWDLLSGLILAIGGGLVSLAAQWVSVSVIDWHVVWVTVVTSAGAYLATKFGFGQKTATV